MNLVDLYLPLKHVHMSLVFISIILFIIRGGAKVCQSHGFNQKWLKIVPHLLDSLLLVSGIALTIIIAQYPISHHWLTVKMLLLVGYIVLGMKTMKSTQVMQQRTYFAAALCCVLLLVMVAKTHHPMGLFSLM
jgi:uncharacterized membrane protein SirB2